MLHAHKSTGSIHVRFARNQKQTLISPKDSTTDKGINITEDAKTAKSAVCATNGSLTSGGFKSIHEHAVGVLVEPTKSRVLSAKQVNPAMLSITTNHGITELSGLAANSAANALHVEIRTMRVALRKTMIDVKNASDVKRVSYATLAGRRKPLIVSMRNKGVKLIE